MIDDNTLFGNAALAAELNVDKTQMIDEVMRKVTGALEEKGYNPVNQIVGYVMSGDPTYITSYGDARLFIQKIERDELLEELVKRYLRSL